MNSHIYFAGVLLNMDNVVAVAINTEKEYGVLVIHDTSGNAHEFDTGFPAEEAARMWRDGFNLPRQQEQIPAHTH